MRFVVVTSVWCVDADHRCGADTDAEMRDQGSASGGSCVFLTVSFTRNICVGPCIGSRRSTPSHFQFSVTRTVYGDFTSAMFDLDTRNWDLQEIFTLVHSWWIAYADVSFDEHEQRPDYCKRLLVE